MFWVTFYTFTVDIFRLYFIPLNFAELFYNLCMILLSFLIYVELFSAASFCLLLTEPFFLIVYACLFFIEYCFLSLKNYLWEFFEDGTHRPFFSTRYLGTLWVWVCLKPHWSFKVLLTAQARQIFTSTLCKGWPMTTTSNGFFLLLFHPPVPVRPVQIS